MYNTQLNLSFEEALDIIAQMIEEYDEEEVLPVIREHEEIDGIYIEAEPNWIRVNILSTSKNYMPFLRDLTGMNTVFEDMCRRVVYTIRTAGVYEILYSEIGRKLFPTAEASIDALTQSIPLQLVGKAKLEFGYNSFVRDTISTVRFDFSRKLSIAEALWLKSYVPETVASIGQELALLQCNGTLYILCPENSIEPFAIETIFENIQNMGDVDAGLDQFNWYWKWNDKTIIISEEDGVVISNQHIDGASEDFAQKLEK